MEPKKPNFCKVNVNFRNVQDIIKEDDGSATIIFEAEEANFNFEAINKLLKAVGLRPSQCDELIKEVVIFSRLNFLRERMR